MQQPPKNLINDNISSNLFIPNRLDDSLISHLKYILDKNGELALREYIKLYSIVQLDRRFIDNFINHIKKVDTN